MRLLNLLTAWWTDQAGMFQTRASRRRTSQRHSYPAAESLELRVLLTNYDIGPGFGFTSLGSFPWADLQPGDNVAIHGRAEPYREHIFLSASGTPENPITISGVLGPQGEVPVIDGANSVQSESLNYAFSGQARRGLITISMSDDDPWGYKPHDLIISNLTVQNAEPNQSFASPSGVVNYFDNAAGIYIERGERIQILNCEVQLCANGIFVASNDSEETQSRDIRLAFNSIHDNGNVGSDRQHNTYTEAIGMVYEYNQMGRPRPGSFGNNIKDRSAGLVVRYNWIDGGAHLLDLVDPEGSSPQAMIDPGFQQTLVYGNVLLDGSGPGTASSLVHYGGDSYVFDGYRKGTLYFHSNTVVIQADRSGPDGRWQTNLLRLDTNDQIADVRNNIIYRAGAVGSDPETEPTGLTLLKNDGGTVHFGTNWISPGWITWYNEDPPNGGTVTGLQNLISNAENDPGFVDLESYQLELLSTSPAVDVAVDLPTAIAGVYDAIWQYGVHRTELPRQVTGTAADLGAFERPGPQTPGGLQFTTSQRTIAESAAEIRLLVVRQQGLSGEVTVQYATEPGTAQSGVDYTAVSGTLVLAAGQTSAEIVIPLLANSPTAGSRTFTVILSEPTGGALLLTRTTLTVTVTEPSDPVTNDPAVVGWQATETAVTAGTTEVVLILERTGDLSQTTTVELRTRNGSAKQKKEFAKLQQTVTFAAGEATKTITIQLTNTRPLKKGPKSIAVEVRRLNERKIRSGEISTRIEITPADPA